MNPLRNKMAELMRSSARKAFQKLDPKSPHAKALRSVDVEAILRDDIERICEALSFLEVTRVMALAAQWGMAEPAKQAPIKNELKTIAEKAAQRAEAKGGKLHVPDGLRALLLEL